MSKYLPSAKPSTTPIDMSNIVNQDQREFPRDMTSIFTVSPGFGESSEYPSVSPNDNPTKDPSPVPIIKPTRVTSENPTKD